MAPNVDQDPLTTALIPDSSGASPRTSRTNLLGVPRNSDIQLRESSHSGIIEDAETYQRMSADCDPLDRDFEAHRIQVGEEGKGLTTAEAKARLEQYGPNMITEEVTPLWRVLFKHYVGGPMQLMIVVAIVLSCVLHKTADIIVMSSLLVLNGSISFHETRKAGNAIAELRKNLAAKARVFRDGVLIEVGAEFLVPGDRVMVKLGDMVPADCTLTPGSKMVTVDESSLTGESLPAEKHAGEMILSGSAMKTGEVEAIVETTGLNTFMGQSAALMQKASPRGHFEKVLLSIALVLVVIALILVTIIFCHLLTTDVALKDNLQLCMVVLVASIPIALPVVATSTMAVGAQRLAQSNAVVTRLAAIEELAGMTELCSDKTGTLTLNQLTIELPPTTFEDFTSEDLFTCAALASKTEAMDAIDTAIYEFVDHAKFANYTVVDHIPFDPTSKRAVSTVEVKETGETFSVCKGAPQKLFDLGGTMMSSEVQDAVDEVIVKFAARGWRPLGVARTVPTAEGGEKWVYVGVFALFDPPRHDTKETIEAATSLGVDVKMVTGDHLLIAKETARELGMGDKIYGPEEWKEAQSKSEKAAQQLVYGADGFAQVMPEDKYYIVEKLQNKGHVTGMTGDGVNDAAALKLADVGIAVAGATDAARAAADIVLLSPGLSTITEAIMRARKIFQRLKNYVIYRINATVQILIFMSISALALTEICDASWAPGQCKPGTQFTMPAIVLVIIAIVNDFTIMSIAYDNVHPSTKPESWKLFEITFVSCTIGFYGVLETYLVYASLSSGKDNQGGPRFIFSGMDPMGNKSHAAVYMALAVGGQLSVFSARTHKFFFSRRPGYCLAISVFGGFLVNLLLASHDWLWVNGQEGLSWEETGRVLLYLLISFIVKDLLKVAAYSMVAYDPFMDWKEHDVSSNQSRINARKRTIFGTLNDEATERRTLEPRVSAVEQAREARCSEARMRRVSHAELHRSICEDEAFGA